MPTAPKTHGQRMRAKGRRHKDSGDLQATRDAVAFRSSQAWQRLRRYIKRRQPLCFDPFGHHRAEGRSEPTGPVHHIESVESAPEKKRDPANCVGLCTGCHARVEAMERRGDATQGLFKGKAAGGGV